MKNIFKTTAFKGKLPSTRWVLSVLGFIILGVIIVTIGIGFLFPAGKSIQKSNTDQTACIWLLNNFR